MKTFIHMGPGMSAYPERQMLEGLDSYIDFWDQPQITSSKNSFETLVDTVENRLKANESRSVVAHSFGAHIATELLRRNRYPIDELIFIAPTFDPMHGFLTLLKILAGDPETPQELAQDIKNKWREISSEPDKLHKLRTIFSLLTRDASFMRMYWGKRNQFLQFVERTKEGPPLDSLTFFNVLDDFLAKPRPLQEVGHKGRVLIHLGDCDPLIPAPKEEGQKWQKLYPHAEIQIHKDCGHFVHLESYEKNLFGTK